MAGVQSFEEEFLTCAICTDIYTDPCTLSCGHSFCRKCVTRFTKARREAIQSKTIPCAFCRQVTPVPKPTRPVEKWTEQIKPSLILVGLIDRHQRGRKQVKGQDNCFTCQEVGETTVASSWCSDCEVTLCSRCAKMHLKVPATKRHEVSDLYEGVNVKQRRKVKCREHEGEQVKFVCKDCNMTACQTCCTIKHRACKHVVTIGSMIPEIKSILEKQRRHLEMKIKDNMACVENEESKIEKLQNVKKHNGSLIKSAISSGITLLQKKEKELLAKLDHVSDTQKAQYQANVKSGQITTQMYQQHCEFIDQALQSESELDMYYMYQAWQSGATELVGNIDPDTSNPQVATEVRFISNMESLKKAITEMGDVDVRSIQCNK